MRTDLPPLAQCRCTRSGHMLIFACTKQNGYTTRMNAGVHRALILLRPEECRLV